MPKKTTTTQEEYRFSNEQVLTALWKTYFKGKQPKIKDLNWFALECGCARLCMKTVKEEEIGT